MGKNNTELLKIAQKYLGQGGATFRKYCGLPSNAAWCNAFVCYIFNKGGDSSLFYGGKKVTYCPTSIKWCQANLAQIPIYLALPMDVIYFDWEPNGVPNHIGFVRERKSDQEVYTIEGNTSGGIVAERTRPVKYVCGCFRPHFKATFDASKALVIDGYFGYNSIACLQKALGITVDGILGKGTVKALQKKAGASQDGSWGVKTSRAVQKMVGTTVDGAFGAKSVKALQKWINKQNEKTETWQDKANAWAVKIAESGEYKYKKWSKDANTHKCPVCYPNSGKGWNCIGFAFACWRHGGGLKSKCNCGVIDNATWERILNASTDKKASEIASEHVGISVKVIRNNGKAIPLSNLKKGDIIAFFNGKTYYHTAYYMGDGKYADSTSSRKPNVKAGVTLTDYSKSRLKVAIRYEGK